MNAAIFTKSAKGLILASGLIAASSIMGYAQDAPVALGANANVWSGTAIDGSAGVIDMLTIGLDGTKTVTGVSLNDTNTWGALAIVFSGLTVSLTDPTPAPAPDPTCTRPGNSCNTPAAENSQADKWQPSIIATTPSTTTTTDTHTNNGHHSK